MILSAVQLLSERGAHGLTIDAVLADSEAPRGSVYYHFPGGRNELVIEAARMAEAYITGVLKSASEGGDLANVLDEFVAFWTKSLTSTQFRAGCPMAALLAGDDVPSEAREIARNAFRTWSAELAEVMVRSGLRRAEADRRAEGAIASIEGAITLCRAYGSTEPLDLAAAQLKAIAGEPV